MSKNHIILLVMTSIASSITLLGFGLALGFEHAMDPDHVAAVSTIVGQIMNLKKASVIGILWGMGHTTTIVLTGILILVLKVRLPNWFSPYLELFVGIMLILLGLDILWKVKKKKLHIHPHRHGDKIHIHFHSHKGSSDHNHIHRSYLVGLVHGLAGSASITLLVLTSIKSMFIGIIYLILFGIGSIIGMLMISVIIYLPFLFTSRYNKINILIKGGIGLVSVIIGLMIIYQTQFFIKRFINT